MARRHKSLWKCEIRTHFRPSCFQAAMDLRTHLRVHVRASVCKICTQIRSKTLGPVIHKWIPHKILKYSNTSDRSRTFSEASLDPKNNKGWRFFEVYETSKISHRNGQFQKYINLESARSLEDKRQCFFRQPIKFSKPVPLNNKVICSLIRWID